MKNKERKYILSFSLAIFLTSLTHYLFISKIELHSTIHVIISLIIIWIWLTIIAIIPLKKFFKK